MMYTQLYSISSWQYLFCMFLSDYKRLRGLEETKIKKTSLYTLKKTEKESNESNQSKPLMVVVKEYIVPTIPKPQMEKIFDYVKDINKSKGRACNKILSCYYNEDNQKLVTIEEYLIKGSARQYMADRRESSLSALIRIAEGLQELHKSGLIHRNLKLENAMMVRDECRMNDLAIPYYIYMHKKARTGYPEIKPLYLAPELSYQDHSQTSDVWALGIMFLQMLLSERLSANFNPSIMQINQYVNRSVNRIKDPQMQLVMRFLLMEETDKRMNLELLISLLKRLQKGQREEITKKDCLIKPVEKIRLPLVNLMTSKNNQGLQIGGHFNNSKIDSIDRTIGNVLLRIQYHKHKQQIKFMFKSGEVCSFVTFHSIYFWNEQFYAERFQTIEDLYVYLRICDQDQFVFTPEGFLQVIFKEERMRRQNTKIQRRDIQFGDMSDLPATSNQIKTLKGLREYHFHNKPLLAKIYEKMGTVYMQEGYPRSAHNAFSYAESEYQKSSGLKTSLMGNLFHNLGLVCFQLGKIEKAIDYLKKCLKITEKIESQIFQTANTYRVLGYIYHTERNMKSAVTCYDWALQLYKTKNKKKEMLQVLKNLSIIYIEIKDYKQAQPILEQYLQIQQSSRNDREITDSNPASIYLNYSHVLFQLEKQQDGLYFCQKAMVHSTRETKKERKNALFLAMMNQLRKEKLKNSHFISQNRRFLQQLAECVDQAHIVQLITFIEN